MSKVEVMKSKKGTVKLIKPFKMLEEEAKFWDTHSILEHINEGTKIGFHQTNKTDSLTVRFEPKDLQKLREKAIQMGVGPTTLIRMWVREYLRKEQHNKNS